VFQTSKVRRTAPAVHDMSIKVQYNPSTGLVSYNAVTRKVQVIEPKKVPPCGEFLTTPQIELALSGITICPCFAVDVGGDEDSTRLVGNWSSALNNTFTLSGGPGVYSYTLTTEDLSGLSWEFYLGTECGGTPSTVSGLDITIRFVDSTSLPRVEIDFEGTIGLIDLQFRSSLTYNCSASTFFGGVCGQFLQLVDVGTSGEWLAEEIL